jgi:8-oxo-dGTP pyrophosphatase MutT (NUDIX family)
VSGLVTRVPADLMRRLEPATSGVRAIEPLRLAAVVALFTEAPGGVSDDQHLVLIERSAALRHHAGQLAFPGGKPEPEDRDLLATALREAHEEVGLPPEGAEVLGRLDPVPTPSGYLIVPFVARAPRGWVPERRAEDEVAAVLHPSLRVVSDPAVHRVAGTHRWRGIDYELHEFAIHDPPLWGATARMTWDLLRRMRA